MKTRLEEYYLTAVRPALIEKFGYANAMQAPKLEKIVINMGVGCLLYTSPSPRDGLLSRMPSSA